MNNLNSFTLNDLAQFTAEGSFDNRASKDFHLFFVGKDNVHEALKYILSRATKSLVMNMFGYDDDELNQIVMDKVKDASILTVITLDKSQAGGVHEKKLLELDKSLPGGLAAFNAHFTVGQSATHQISHTKGGVIDGKIAWEGSTNWSASGEGTFVVKGELDAVGVQLIKGTNTVKPLIRYKAQNNTNSFITDPDTCTRFQAELLAEHLIASKQQK